MTESDLRRIFEHCHGEYPNEACGILAGREKRVEKVYSLRSENPSPVFYRIDAQEQFRVFRDMRDGGMELLGIYHSHTGSPAFPSSVDVELAYYPDAAYVIVSLMDKSRPEIKAYNISGGNITDVPLQISR